MREEPKWWEVMVSTGSVRVTEGGAANYYADRPGDVGRSGFLAAVDEAVAVAWSAAKENPGSADAVGCYRALRGVQTRAHGAPQEPPWAIEAAKERRGWSDCNATR